MKTAFLLFLFSILCSITLTAQRKVLIGRERYPLESVTEEDAAAIPEAYPTIWRVFLFNMVVPSTIIGFIIALAALIGNYEAKL